MTKSSTELKRCARLDLNGNYGISMLVLIVNGMLPSLLLFPFSRNVSETNSLFQNLSYFLAVLIISFISTILSCGVIRFHVRLAKEENRQFSDIFAGFKNYPQKIIGAYLLLYARIVLVLLPGCVLSVTALSTSVFTAPLIGLSLILLIAGIIWGIKISLQYALIFYLFMDNPEMSVQRLFSESKELMNGNKLRLLYLSLSFIGMYLLGLLSFGIGLLWVTPYVNQTYAQFYLTVLREKQARNSFEPSEQMDSPFSEN
ncbi:MAG: DUF975 family protein [Lachnospiraceae bacterium]|nr:DUF975 family protein [Lachnospiraceae bacterium]